MESPVRICLGAALVVNILLLSGTSVSGNAIPHDTTSTTVRDDRVPRFSRLNSTWIPRSRPKTPDVSLNELNPKDSTSEEHTEKNAKYKDRGRIKYHGASSTESNLRRVKSTENPKLIIITPTPEVKKPAEMVDRMRNFKKTKLPLLTKVQSTTPIVVKKQEVKQSHEEYEEEDDEEEKDSLEKYTSAKFDNFFTIPSFNYDEFNQESDSESSDNKVKSEYSSPSYGGFSSFFPREVSYGYKDTTHDIYKSESFFDFDTDHFETELTTPKNEFFDQKYKKISTSIIKNLDTIKSKATPSPNATNVQKIIKENVGLEKSSNNTPGNKSTVFIKNTKEIRLLDNDGAGSANKELSDVQGTSIYYEMSVLSTETYAIDHSEDDCDEPVPTASTTPSTSEEEEVASMKVAQIALPVATRPPLPDPSLESVSVSPSSYIPISSIHPPIITTSIPVSIQNSISSTEKNKFSNFNRNRKRLNYSSNKNSPNSVTKKTDSISTTINPRISSTRKFHNTTPKPKPTWLMPRRNITKVHHRPTLPTTIYAEHFTKPTNRSRLPAQNKLTTVSSDIDPVQQGEISGNKKVGQSQEIAENTVPGLWKRGSTRFTTSTSSSAEAETETEWQIPPTSTAWALAGLLSPPASGGNKTGTIHKNVDENELQKVLETTDKKETTTTMHTITTTTTPNPINNDIIPKKVTEVEQNKLSAPIVATSPKTEQETNTQTVKPESLSTESYVSNEHGIQTTTQATKDKEEHKTETSWISITTESPNYTTKSKSIIKSNATVFESITKLPNDITTPQDENTADSEVSNTVNQNRTTKLPDFEITTIRFTYVPTEEVTTETETESIQTTVPSTWHSVYPTRTRVTTIEDTPITTYRPKYITTETEEESTTIIPETTSRIEVSSQVLENATKAMETTETPIKTAITTEMPTTTEFVTTTPIEITTEPTTVEITTQYTTELPVTTTPAVTSPPTTHIPTTTEEVQDTTTVIVEVVTEINTEREKRTTTVAPESTETDENSGSNEVMTKETVKPSITTTKPTTEFVIKITTTPKTTEKLYTTTAKNAKINDVVTTTEFVTRTSDIDEATTYGGSELTTEASTRTMGDDDPGSGAAIAIAVSTIGVIALVLLIGLLLVVRRRGRRGVYAQRCTPVSLDAYSLDSVSVGHRKGNQRLRASKRSYGNPAYDDEVTSHPMHYAALANFAQDIESMSAEFAEIPTVTVRPEEVPPGCEDKNRYSNVLPLPETRVPLKRIGNDPTTEYINANFVTGPGNIRNYYIACQAPLANTVVDFWRMIWEQNSRVIVMLTEYMENGVEKCYEYLPPSEVSDNKRTFGDFKIILKKREQRDKYAVSSVQLINTVTRTWREITHLWYFWPAKGVPDDYDSVIDFICEMRSYMKISQTAKEYDEEGVEVIYDDQNRSSFSNLSKLRSEESGNGVNVYSPAKAEEQLRRAAPSNGTLGRMKAASEIEGIRATVVTCASGAGRAGALVALDVCARAPPARVDLPRAVRTLRAQRPHALSNRHHYIFVYKVLAEYGNKMLGVGVDTI